MNDVEEYTMKLRGYYLAELIKMGKISDEVPVGAYGETVLKIAHACCKCELIGNCDGAVTCPIIKKELSTSWQEKRKEK